MKKFEIKPGSGTEQTGRKIFQDASWREKFGWIEIIFVGEGSFFGRVSNGSEQIWANNSDWYEYEPPKQKRKIVAAPAWINGLNNDWLLTTTFFKSVYSVQDAYPGFEIIWPAKINPESGCYELEVEVEE